MEPSDIQLMLRVKAGDTEAFRQLAHRYRPRLRQFFAAVLVDRSQADDFAQETLLRVWLTRERYEPTGRFSTYLFQIGKHYWLNQRKRFRRSPAPTRLEDGLRIEAAPAAQPEAVLLEEVHRAHVIRAIGALPERCRLVFALSHFEGLRYAEIACRLGIPLGTVKSRMAEAVRRLRAELMDADQGG